MAVKISPVLNEQQFSDAGVLLSGGKIETYLAGSTTPAATYKTSAGVVAQSNPIILNTRGEVDNAIYLTTGISYKLVLKNSAGDVLRTFDNIEGVNDSSTTADQWISSGVEPTFISATQFSLSGDQTTAFHVNRRVKLLVTAGTVYGYISASAYGVLTTITVVLDSGVLDSGLSNVQLALITPNNTSLFKMQTANINDASITQQKLSTNVVGNGPAFSAHALSLQTVTSGVATKANFATEEYDTNSNYDTTLSRFTATVAGYYQFTINIRAAAGTVSQTLTSIGVNGSIVQVLHNISANVGVSSAVTKPIFLNIGDYVEAFPTIIGTGTLQIGGTVISNTSNFSGYLVRAA